MTTQEALHEGLAHEHGLLSLGRGGGGLWISIVEPCPWIPGGACDSESVQGALLQGPRCSRVWNRLLWALATRGPREQGCYFREKSGALG